MKKSVIIAFVLVMTIGSGYAQRGGGDPAARIQKEINDLTRELSLSKDQVAKVTPIINEAQKKQEEALQKMRDGGNVDREKMHEERVKLVAETDKQIKAVLTAEQGVKLDAYRKAKAVERAKSNKPPR